MRNFSEIIYQFQVYPVSMDFTRMFEHNMHPIETIVQLNESTKFVLMDLKDGWSRMILIPSPRN